MSTMIHPLTGADYISEQAFNASIDKAVAAAVASAVGSTSKIFSGAGAPSAVAGSKPGDVYLRTSNRTAYIRTTHTTEEWKLISNA